MPPPLELWSAAELPSRIQVTADGKRRKERIELEKCKLLEMVQYNCKVEDVKGSKEGSIKCLPVVRLFRRCEQKTGVVMVETTSWEGKR